MSETGDQEAPFILKISENNEIKILTFQKCTKSTSVAFPVAAFLYQSCHCIERFLMFELILYHMEILNKENYLKSIYRLLLSWLEMTQPTFIALVATGHYFPRVLHNI